MAISRADVEIQLDRFKKIGPHFNMELDERKGRYVHILRNGKIIGCFKRIDGVIMFEFHNSHRKGREKVPVDRLTDEEIKDVIDNTPRKKLRS